MGAGELRRRITFQRRSTTQDASGQQSASWSDIVTVWAGIESISAREQMAAQAVQSEVTHRIKVRYRIELASPMNSTTYRILYGTRVFGITGAMNINERNRMIEMMASEGLNNG